MKQLLLIMKTAPIGLGAYFAYQVGILGLNYLVHMQPLGLYYGVCAFLWYFCFYAFIAGGTNGLKVFLDNIHLL
jgi:Na+/H+-dicarboxylate symporter